MQSAVITPITFTSPAAPLRPSFALAAARLPSGAIAANRPLDCQLREVSAAFPPVNLRFFVSKARP